MKDGYGRNIDYARISVTDKCNLRCMYCMPEDIEHVDMKDILTFEETVSIASVMAKLGISRIKLTGGEPLIRRGICELARMLKSVDGIKEVTITTNGVLLEKYVPELASADIDGVNVSIDTLDPEKYKSITGTDCLPDVTAGIKSAVSAGLKVKLNAVTVGSLEDVSDLIGFSKDLGINIRFIELMPIGAAKGHKGILHSDLLKWFFEKFPGAEKCETDGNGPAGYYSIPGYDIKVGFISPLSDSFCAGCNRVRLTTRGFLKSCLCFDKGEDLMGILRSDAPEEKKNEMLGKTIEKAISEKPSGHDFAHVENVSETLPMSAIGG